MWFRLALVAFLDRRDSGALSGATLRIRLERLLQRLCLPTPPNQSPKMMTLASFRPGGATWLIGRTESAKAVKRKGRWASFKTMEIYLQEVNADTCPNDISYGSRTLVLQAFRLFFYHVAFQKQNVFSNIAGSELTPKW